MRTAACASIMLRGPQVRSATFSDASPPTMSSACGARFFQEPCRDVVIPLLEQHSGKKAGADFGVCMNPEFLREGSSIADFHAPPMTIIGELDPRSGDLVEALYAAVSAPSIRTKLAVAEMVKYVGNAYHGLKVTFANEIGNICKRLGLDGREVMEIFCRDQKLNISAAYLQPGFAFGGSCLPKDLRALLQRRGNSILSRRSFGRCSSATRIRSTRRIDSSSGPASGRSRCSD